ncbi:hypothetical protein PM082_004370 [Marasmius tenuissimus]|nr:hypothetical protein PM082_004370 [Marasmius tenuissimus]
MLRHHISFGTRTVNHVDYTSSPPPINHSSSQTPFFCHSHSPTPIQLFFDEDIEMPDKVLLTHHNYLWPDTSTQPLPTPSQCPEFDMAHNLDATPLHLPAAEALDTIVCTQFPIVTTPHLEVTANINPKQIAKFEKKPDEHLLILPECSSIDVQGFSHVRPL